MTIVKYPKNYDPNLGDILAEIQIQTQNMKNKRECRCKIKAVYPKVKATKYLRSY